MSRLVLKTTNRVAFEEQPPKPDPRVLVFSTASTVSFLGRTAVDNYILASDELYNTANVIFPQKLPA